MNTYDEALPYDAPLFYNATVPGGAGAGDPDVYRVVPWQRRMTRVEFERWQKQEAEQKRLRAQLREEEELLVIP